VAMKGAPSAGGKWFRRQSDHSNEAKNEVREDAESPWVRRCARRSRTIWHSMRGSSGRFNGLVQRPRVEPAAPVEANRPVISLRKAWESVRTSRASAIVCTIYGTRFCTKLGRAGVPERTMLDIIGHVNELLQRGDRGRVFSGVAKVKQVEKAETTVTH
jgi:hypothetical protein